MRAHHLRNLIEPFLGERFDLRLESMPPATVPGRQWLWVTNQPRGAVYFFTKYCTEAITQENLNRLHKKSVGVCFDLVDRDFRTLPHQGVECVDIYLCSSYAQLHELKRRQSQTPQFPGEAMLLLHNVDERLYGMHFRPLRAISTAYCGSPKSVFLTDRLRSRMDILDASNTKKMARIIGALPNYNFHYGVRRSSERKGEMYTPFTKGFTAAACGANILVNRQADDAIEFLGEDYPYMVSHVDEAEIADMLDRAEASYGDTEWQTARDIMRSVEARTNPAAIARQAEAVLRELGV